MPDRSNERFHGVIGEQPTSSSDRFIEDKIADLRRERAGLTGGIIDASDTQILTPTIDVSLSNVAALPRNPTDTYDLSSIDPNTKPRNPCGFGGGWCRV